MPLPDNVASLKCACAVCTRIRYRSLHIPIYNSFLLSFFSETPLLVSILRYLLFFCTVILCLQMLEVNKNERKKTRVECEMLQCYRRNQQKVLKKKNSARKNYSEYHSMNGNWLLGWSIKLRCNAHTIIKFWWKIDVPAPTSIRIL